MIAPIVRFVSFHFMHCDGVSDSFFVGRAIYHLLFTRILGWTRLDIVIGLFFLIWKRSDASAAIRVGCHGH